MPVSTSVTLFGALMPMTCASPPRPAMCRQALRPPSPAMLTTLAGTLSRRLAAIAVSRARAERSVPPPGGVLAMISMARSGRQRDDWAVMVLVFRLRRGKPGQLNEL
jgi:hypothetical protein